MFHQGDLQSGITTAIQQGKLVACFVRDESPESQTWENEWLQEHTIQNLLPRKAVVLRIQAGSQEAGFLSAFCPVERVPTLVVIHNGQLRENLSVGVTHEEFTQRMKAMLGADEAPVQLPQPVSQHPASLDATVEPPHPDQALSEPQTTSTESTTTASTQPFTSTSSPSAPAPSPSDATTSPSPVQSLLSDRRTRLDAERQRAAEAEAAARRDAAKALREAAEAQSSSSTNSAGSARLSYAAQQRQRIQQERRERDRILAQIEADKAARREREARRREAAAAATGADSNETVRPPQAASAPVATPARDTGAGAGGKAESAIALQIRLFDGSTLRHSFPGTCTLSSAVRPWLDSTSPAALTAPYTFKHVLPPAPPVALSDRDEETPLRELGMWPSATLVLVPVRGAVGAYEAAWGGPGWLGTAYSGLRAVGGVVGGAVGAVTGLVGVGGGGGTGARAGEGEGEGERGGVARTSGGVEERRTGRVSIRTLADQRAEGEGRDERQFYNGNQLNFEPNKDKPGDEQ